MSKIYILSGEELVLKDSRVKELYSHLNDYEYKSVYIEPYRSKSYTYILEEINLFLSTYDFFSNSKVLRVIVQKPEQINAILSGIDIIGYEDIIIFDLRCPDYLVKNLNIKFKDYKIEVENFFAFKDYERDKVFNFIEDLIVKNNIKFKSDEDKLFCYDYIFNSSQGSYCFIYNELNKVKILNTELDIDIFKTVVGSLSNQNNYKTCSQIFDSKNIEELNYSLENNLNCISEKSFRLLILILIGKIKDYILLNNGQKCFNKANFYTFKNSNIKIVAPDKLIEKLNGLLLDIKAGDDLPKEEFIWTLITYFKFK